MKNITPTLWTRIQANKLVRHLKENPADLLLAILAVLTLETAMDIDELIEEQI